MNSDAFELNKIAGATLFALLIFFSARTLSDIIFTVHAPETPGFDVAVTEPEGHTPAAEAKAAVPLPQLLQEASAERGASVAKKCAACHTFEQGGANKVGPNLHGIVGHEVASVSGFAYSPALQELKGKFGTWTYEHLNNYLTNPKAAAPGTKMAFAGIPNDGQRADLLLYLREQSPEAPPLPEAAAAAPAQGEKPAEGAPADQKPAAQQPAADQPQGAPAAQAEPEKPASPTAQQPADQSQGAPAAQAEPEKPAGPSAQEPAAQQPPAAAQPQQETPPAAQDQQPAQPPAQQ